MLKLLGMRRNLGFLILKVALIYNDHIYNQICDMSPKWNHAKLYIATYGLSF